MHQTAPTLPGNQDLPHTQLIGGIDGVEKRLLEFNEIVDAITRHYSRGLLPGCDE
ncbi:MAG: hypothetical protein OSA93_14415 [Akkermansiaceae bacterium]|nr:hypothetical protein [Akkermansiaceae bacterium]